MTATACPDPTQLKAYVLGTLSETDADTVVEHLSSCSACEDTARHMEGVADTVLAALRRPAGDDDCEREPAYRRALVGLRAMGPSALVAADRPSAAGAATESLGLQELGDYRLLARLGKGGMGTVYKALHTKLDRTVALKILPRAREEDPRAIARFEREMKAVGRLNHPNVVQALDARELSGVRFLVMKYVEGLDLAELVRRRGPLPIAAACELIRQVAVGLQYIHQHGLVHRDIKLSNLMLTGQAPFGGPQYPGNLEKIVAHARDRVPPIRRLRADVPEELVVVLDRALAKDPAERFAAPAELATAVAPLAQTQALSGLLGDSPEAAVSPPAGTSPIGNTGEVRSSPETQTPPEAPKKAVFTAQPATLPAFDPYHRWLGIPSEDQPPHHYRLLGITPFEEDPDVIATAADRQMAHLRTFQAGKHAALSQRLLNEVAGARVCLLNPQKKAAYDAGLRRQLQPPVGRELPLSAPPARPPQAPPAKVSEPSVPGPVPPVRAEGPLPPVVKGVRPPVLPPPAVRSFCC